MKYKGIKIEDNVSTYKTEKVCEVFGDFDATNEIHMTNKDFSSFVDKLVKVRDKFKENNNISFIINVFEGYCNCDLCDDENTVPSIYIETEEEIKESPEERKKRIERQKKLIDKHIEESEKQKRQMIENQKKDAIHFLENLGYKVI
jgi:hypothetical protein